MPEQSRDEHCKTDNLARRVEWSSSWKSGLNIAWPRKRLLKKSCSEESFSYGNN